MGDVTEGMPKAMVSIGGMPLLHKLVAQFRASGIRRVVVIRGYAAEKVHAPEVEFVDNEEFEGTGELLSLSKAAEHLQGDAVISFGDILFRKYILEQPARGRRRHRHRGRCRLGAATRLGRLRRLRAARRGRIRCATMKTEAFLVAAGPSFRANEIHGEWIGLIKTTSARLSRRSKRALTELSQRAGFPRRCASIIC